ncbi:signal peptidase II [Spongiactinospora sp. TRM90649]|uniref:signal peptidase II n=1 Tax=Spongiactinospora sp. TRM90649 TaxID=3031114 RepID=UPI0023F67D34|nr:signal peptidase II [Spongiactinospora sp. TRM90649]MDF5757779.1 signal peptidase II [Spongiactinospora sp. TRM90649]
MAGERGARETRAGLRLYGWMLVLAAGVLLVDQASKYWALSALSNGETIAVIPELIKFRLLLNPGAAFSIGEGMTWVFALAAGAAVVGVLYFGRRVRSGAWAVVLGPLLGGATSHLLDRLFRPPSFGQGHVVDFIDYGGLFVGNVADIALVGSCAVLMLLSLRGVPFDGVAEKPEEAEKGDPSPGPAGPSA